VQHRSNVKPAVNQFIRHLHVSHNDCHSFWWLIDAALSNATMNAAKNKEGVYAEGLSVSMKNSDGSDSKADIE
jgi:hypothetical protein